MSLGPDAHGALELASAFERREVSAVEAMKSCLDAIDRHNKWANAIIGLREREALLREAAERDAERAAGRVRGWLHGVPVAVKDLAPARGMPFTQGSPIFRDRIAEEDAPFVARMRADGAILIGKTNTPEFGLGSQTFNPVWGATRNAYDPERTAGGSSGGAAVALALGMLAVADGSDHAGSLRNPAGYNNVYGLRPSLGRVVESLDDVFSPRLTVAGPMARSVEDLAALLATLAGPDPRAPLSIDEDPERFRASLDCDIDGLRIGWLGDLGGRLAMEPGVIELCEQALRTFEALGAEVEPVTPDFPMDALWDAWVRLRHVQAGAPLLPLWRDARTRDLLKEEARWEVEQGLKLSAYDVEAAAAVRSAWYQATRALFERVDILVLPTAQLFPFPVETRWPREIAGRTMDTYHRWMEVVVPATMSACPVLAVPAGFDGRGLPMGLQLWGPMRSEFRLLQIARAYERETDWPRRAPPPATLG